MTIGPDGDVFAFALPAVDPAVPTPVIGFGDFVVAFSDRPEVQAAQAYLSSPDWATRRAKLDGTTSANTGVPIATYWRSGVAAVRADAQGARGPPSDSTDRTSCRRPSDWARS